MASVNPQYTLVDIAADLDWRPVLFIEPLPQDGLCSVCGIFPKRRNALPCGHVACLSCFGRCAEAGRYACPVDGKSFSTADVKGKVYPEEELLRKKVRCWNAGHGCPVVLDACELPKHFQQSCSHHCVTCPKCSTIVLRSDMCQHIKASCHALAHKAAAGEVQLCNPFETRLIGCVIKVARKQLLDLKSLLEKAFGGNSAIYVGLVSMSKSMNCFKESLRHGMEAVRQITDQTNFILQRISTLHVEITSACQQSTGKCAQLKDAIDIAVEEVRKDNRALLGEMKKVLLQAGGCVTRCEFFVRGVEKLEATAIIYGYASYAGGRSYLRGYNIVPGIVLENERKCISLRVWLQLQKGDLDDIVHWPFEHVVRFTIVHPSAVKDCVITCKPCPDIEEYQKPTESSDRSVSFPESVTMEALKRDGYVHNDELRVVWELL